MKGVAFVRYCQKLVKTAKRDFWKLERADLHGDVLEISSNLGLPPVLVMRALLKRRGLTRRQINLALNGKLKVEPSLEQAIAAACRHDPVYSPDGLAFSKWRGDEGEFILSLWLDQLKMKYQRDLGRGIPDFLLNKKMTFFGREVAWIESKASIGMKSEMKSDEKQFKRFDAYGPGAVVYWFGVEADTQRFVVSGEDLIGILPTEFAKKVKFLLEYVPSGFDHLLVE